MYRTTNALYIAGVSLLATLVAFPFTINAANGIPCDNPHTATALDIAAGLPPGSQVCTRDYQQSGVTPESGEAKEFLKSLPKEPRSKCGTESDLSIGRLNAQFAICAANFVRAYQNAYGDSIRINSAFRTPIQQVCVCRGATGLCGAPGKLNPQTGVVDGGSNHQRGVAIDITPASEDYARMQTFARANQKFGVFFPYGMGDRVHVEPSTVACGRGGNVSVPGIADASPSSGITKSIRQALNPQPEPQAAPPQQTAQTQTSPPLGMQNSTPYQPGTCAPQFYCSNNNLYYRASTCVDQVNQVCPNGCSGVSCIGSPASYDLLSLILSTSTKRTATTTRAATSTLSVFDQISAFAGPTVGTVATNIATSVNLAGLNGQGVMMLRGNPQTQLPPSDTFANSYQLDRPRSQQTFVSPDLSQNTGGFANTGQQSTFQKTLADMKAVVLRILDYLKPFGRSEREGDHLPSE